MGSVDITPPLVSPFPLLLSPTSCLHVCMQARDTCDMAQQREWSSVANTSVQWDHINQTLQSIILIRALHPTCLRCKVQHEHERCPHQQKLTSTQQRLQSAVYNTRVISALTTTVEGHVNSSLEMVSTPAPAAATKATPHQNDYQYPVSIRTIRYLNACLGYVSHS